MKCFMKSLLGLDQFNQNESETCTTVPPIVKSLIASTLFIVFMVILSHILRT